jgi:DNA repair protein RadC
MYSLVDVPSGAVPRVRVQYVSDLPLPPASPVTEVRDIIALLFEVFPKELSTEELWGLFLDSRNQIVASAKMASGGWASAVVPTQVIAQAALLLNSPNVVLVHNHPSGSPDPSRDDIAATTHVKKGLKLLGIHLLDHIIVTTGPGKRGWYSLREHDLV